MSFLSIHSSRYNEGEMDPVSLFYDDVKSNNRCMRTSRGLDAVVLSGQSCGIF